MDIFGHPDPFPIMRNTAIIPAIPDDSQVKLKPEDHPMLKLVESCWFFNSLHEITLRQRGHIDFDC